ncbi:MAG: radical SAM protein [bacterium]
MVGWLTINRACNLRCLWCYAKGKKFSPRDNMSIRTLKKSISIMQDLGIKKVCITGGEPTIYSNIFKVVEIIAKKEMEPLIVTNGIKLANKDFFLSLLDAGLKGFSLSLKAPNGTLYKKWTGLDAFADIVSAIKNLNEHDVSYAITYEVTKLSIGTLAKLIKTLTETKVKYFNLDLGRPILTEGLCRGDNIPRPANLAKAIVDCYPLLKKAGFRFAISLSIPFCLMPRGFVETMIEDETLLSGCQIHQGTGFIVDPNGYLLPCNHFCDQPLGKISHDFSNASEYKVFRKSEQIMKFYDFTANYPHNRCIDCKWWDKCGSGCFIRWLYNDATDLIPTDS